MTRPPRRPAGRHRRPGAAQRRQRLRPAGLRRAGRPSAGRCTSTPSPVGGRGPRCPRGSASPRSSRPCRTAGSSWSTAWSPRRRPRPGHPGGRPAAARRPRAHAARPTRRRTRQADVRARAALCAARRRDHQRAGPVAGCSSTTGCRRTGSTSPSPAVDPAPLAPGPPPAASCCASAAVTRAKGHDVLLAALAQVADLPGTAPASGPLDLDPGFVGRLRAPGDAAGIADRVDLTGPLTGDRPRRRVRRSGPAGAGLAAARPTGWSSPRRWPAGSRSSRSESAACPRRSADGRRRAGRGCSCQPGDPDRAGRGPALLARATPDLRRARSGRRPRERRRTSSTAGTRPRRRIAPGPRPGPVRMTRRPG